MNVKTEHKTIKDVLAEGEHFLSKKGNKSARAESQKIIAFGLNMETVDLYLSLNKPLTEVELGTLREYFKERARGKPLQYITGDIQFRYLKLKVNEKTFIARPETELIVEIAADLVKEGDKVLELGTGSGAIALSITKETAAFVDATDICEAALSAARDNGKLNKVEGVNWVRSDWFENVENKYDLVICNPPYVSSDMYKSLPKEIKEFEPKIAVTDGADGLKCIEKIIVEAPDYLKKGGKIVLEIGDTQKNSVRRLLNNAGYNNVSFQKDLTGRIRFVIAS